MRKISLTVVVTVFMLGGAYSLPVSATEQLNNTLEMEQLHSEQLRLILAVPNVYWQGPLAQVALAMEEGDVSKANRVLSLWLQEQPQDALLALPFMKQFPFYFSQFQQATVYAEYLLAHGGEQAMQSLALLDLNNTAVSIVGFELLHRWWRQNPEQCGQWLAKTPAFFDDLQIEELIRRMTGERGQHAILASLFYTLPMDDPRRERFFTEVLDAWLALAPQDTIDYMTGIRRQTRQTDRSYDNAAIRIAYFFSNRQQQQQALAWLASVTHDNAKAVALRDFSYAISSQEDLQAFEQWFANHPIDNPMIDRDIRQQLASLSSLLNTQESQDHD